MTFGVRRQGWDKKEPYGYLFHSFFLPGILGLQERECVTCPRPEWVAPYVPCPYIVILLFQATLTSAFSSHESLENSHSLMILWITSTICKYRTGCWLGAGMRV